MEATLIKEQEEQEKRDLENPEAFQKQVKMGKLQETLLEFYHMQQQQSELAERVKEKREEIRDLYIDAEIPAVVSQAADGKYICVQEKIIKKEVLDKDGLALELQIEKKELKTPWDFSKLTQQKKLTPEMITKHTHEETTKDIKISKTKRNPLNKEEKKKHYKKK